MDLRERVVRAVEGGASRRVTAAKFEVSISFVVKLMQRWQRCGTLQPERLGGAKRSALAAHGELVRALVAAEPDLTIAELRHRRRDGDGAGHHWPAPRPVEGIRAAGSAWGASS